MKSRILAIIVLAAIAVFMQSTHADDAPLRLALLYPPEAAAVGDLLTAELSKQPGLELVEREQIRKIFQEKSLNAVQAKQDWANIGQLLGAAGLIVLDKPESKALPLRLIWAERGVVVYETVLPSTDKDAQKAVAAALPQIQKALKKLAELRHAGKSAVAMHITGIRADSGQDIELRQSLGLLFAQRIQNEPGWVVVDRRNLTDAVFEKDLAQGKGDQKLVTATHRLTLGFAKEGDQLKIRGQLDMPGSAPKRFEVAGNIQEPGALAATFFAELRKAMNLRNNNEVQAWDPLQEANELYAWAAGRNGKGRVDRLSSREVYEACSAAWALGLHSEDVAVLRVKSLCAWAWPEQGFYEAPGYEFNCTDLRKDRGAPQRMLAALELASQLSSITDPKEHPAHRRDSYTLMCVTYSSAEMLRAIYDDHNEELFSSEIEKLRQAIRQAVDAGKLFNGKYQRTPRVTRFLTILNHSSLWQKDYATAQKQIEDLLLKQKLEEDATNARQLWQVFEKNLGDLGSIGYADKLHEAHSRPPRYVHVPLFYPKKPADMAECIRRTNEVISKLEASPDSHRKSFAVILRELLANVPEANEPIPAQGELRIEDFLVDNSHLDQKPDERLKTLVEMAGVGDRVNFILRLIAERKQGQYLSPAILSFVNPTGLNRPEDEDRYKPEDAARLIEGLDAYRNQVEADFPINGSNDKKRIGYLSLLSDGMEAVATYYGMAADALKRIHPSAPIEPNAFLVGKYRFAKHWSGVAFNPCLNRCTTDGRNLFVPEDEGSFEKVGDCFTGALVLSPPDWKPKRVCGRKDNKLVVIDHRFSGLSAFDGNVFYAKLAYANQSALNCLRGDGSSSSIPLAADVIRDLRFLGYFPPFSYFFFTAQSKITKGDRSFIQRWNIESNTLEVLGDSLRSPSVTPLDDIATAGLLPERGMLMTKLPDGNIGLLLKAWNSGQHPFSKAFRITPATGAVSELGDWDTNNPPTTEWAKSFEEADNLKPCLPWKILSRVKPGSKTPELCEERDFFPPRFLGSPSYSGKSGSSTFTVRAVSPFVMGEIRGAVVMERETGREMKSRTYLAFFEPDGIKSIPLRFEMKPDDLTQLRQFMAASKKMKNTDSYLPNPRTIKFHWPSDNAIATNDALFISNYAADVLWFLTKAEVEEARKLATLAGK